MSVKYVWNVESSFFYIVTCMILYSRVHSCTVVPRTHADDVRTPTTVSKMGGLVLLGENVSFLACYRQTFTERVINVEFVRSNVDSKGVSR